jgi:hypothetical protein
MDATHSQESLGNGNVQTDGMDMLKLSVFHTSKSCEGLQNKVPKQGLSNMSMSVIVHPTQPLANSYQDNK